LDQLATARRGLTQVVLLAGDPGIGKTHLIGHLAAEAASGGVLVLRGGASQAEGMPPYLPFLEALGQHIHGADPDELHRQTGRLAPVLATIFPELTSRVESLPASYALPPEQARLRLYEAVGFFLAAIAAARPVLLVLDDLHWADPSSLDLLCYVARRQPAVPLLILGAYRAGDAEPALGRAVAELNRLRVLTTIAVGALSSSDIAALAEALLGGPVDARATHLLAAHSEGNPFFAEELLRNWLETGILVRREQTWVQEGRAPSIPPGIASAIGQRLRRLAPEVVELLQDAAIIGRSFDASLLAQVAGRTDDAVEERLGEAVRAQLLQTDPDDFFRFTHDKIRESLYDGVTTARRIHIHGFIGRVLEARRSAGASVSGVEAQLLADLAFHFGRSGDRERAADYARLAGDQALGMYAAEEAMAHYQTALDAIDSSDERRGPLLLDLGDAAVRAGAEPEAVRSFQLAQSWFRGVGDAQQEGQAAHRLGQTYWRQEKIAEARAALESALALLTDDAGQDLVHVQVDLASLLAVNLNEQTTGIHLAKQALSLAEQLGDDALLAAASRTLGNLLVRSNQLSEGTRLLEGALALAGEADAPVEAAECCAHLCGACIWQGAMRRGREVAQTWLALAQRCHDPYQLRHVYIWLAYFDGYVGRSAQAEQWLSLAQETVERLASPQPRAWLTYGRGGFAYMRGDYETAEKLVQEALGVFRETNPDALGWYLGFLCMAQAAEGKTEEAHASMEELEARAAALPEGILPAAASIVALVEASLLLGDRERLERLYPRLMPFEGEFQDLLIDRLLGQIETVQGRWTEARKHLAAAEAMARREEMLWELAPTLVAAAELALAEGERGNKARAEELLREALELYGRFGNAYQQQRVRRRLRSTTHGQTGRARLPAGLSPRQAEVLRLVAEGRTNRQIAEELVLSEKTVTNHLTSIFNKTGADNRAAATAFAFRHGLA
jgi:DNA-binding CsgD family transcriptional regulator